MRGLAGLGVLVAGLALMTGGCSGSSPAPTASSPVHTGTTPSVTPSATPTGAASSPTGPPQLTPTLDLSAYAFAGVKSPSGHIGCLFQNSPASVRCDVNNAHWNVATPANCHLAYGDSAGVGQGTADLGCHGDTVIGSVPRQPVLPYGQTVRYKDLLCTSATTGMTCRNPAGHGFTVARDSYRLF